MTEIDKLEENIKELQLLLEQKKAEKNAALEAQKYQGFCYRYCYRNCKDCIFACPYTSALIFTIIIMLLVFIYY